MSPGSIFLIVFFVGFAVYFAVGAVVKWRVYSASGVELVPNTLFWVGLPGLIKVLLHVSSNTYLHIRTVFCL